MTLDDGERVPVDLDLDEEFLSLRTGGSLIGTWPVKYCRVSRSGRGAVILSLDGEKVVFEPQDLPKFASIAAQRLQASTLADRIGVVRDIPTPDASPSVLRGSHLDPDPVRWNWVAGLFRGALVLIVGAALVILAGLGLRSVDRGDPPEFAGTTITVPAVVPLPPPLFDQTVEEFAVEWNLTAAAFGVPVQIRDVLVAGSFESQLTRFLTMQGRTDDDDTIDSLVLVMDPSGDPDEDAVALSALGVALAVASPELDREGRDAVLARLGLTDQNLDLTELDAEVEVGTVVYSISYISEFDSLLFVIGHR